MKFAISAAIAALLVAGPVAAADGKAIYAKSCAGCHSVMNPKLGDKAAWAPLLKMGAAAVTASVIKGKGAMPPRGGAGSDADAKAATEFMISQAK